MTTRAAEDESAFLAGIAAGRHRKGAGQRLRKIIARRERAQFGAVACYCCGHAVSPGASTIEHILALARGGTWAIENLALSHEVCNQQRGVTPTERAAIAPPPMCRYSTSDTQGI